VIVTIFRSRLREEHESEYYEWSERMNSLVRTIDGFISIKTFRAHDGERVSIVEFETKKAHDEWKRHPGHIEAQRLGRERFYSEYKIQVLDNPRSYSFNMNEAGPDA
jgi:heme-degrading monooxygenase HmoA